MVDFELERSQNHYVYHQFNDDLQSGLHFHNSFEFIYVYEGTLIVQINKVNYTVNKQQSILILPEQVHSIQSQQGSKNYLCIFSSDYVSDFAALTTKSKLANPIFCLPSSEALEFFLQEDINKYSQKAFFYLLCGLALSGGLQKVEYSEDKQLIYKVTDYISKNFKENISLKQIAKDLGYNYTYLSNFFNKHFTGYSNFLNEYRINHAKQMLSGTTHTISRVAIECGFFSIRNFNRAFLKIEKISPKKFKDLNPAKRQ